MRLKKFARGAALALSLALLSAGVNAAPVRIGYWTSGVAVGLGAVLEAGDFLKQQGVDATFVHFSEINAPTSALAANAIDLSFSAPAASAFNLVTEGVPVKIFLATAPADVKFVVPVNSPITSMSQLRGKKIGMSPAGSSVASMTSAVLAANYGIKSSDFSLVPGNEARLAQFLVQNQVDAATLRSITVAQLSGVLKVRQISSFDDEWKKLTKSNAKSYLGTAAARTDLLEHDPQTVAKIIVALHNAIVWGSTHPKEVSVILQKSTHMPAADADVYAAHWNELNDIAFEPIDIDTLKREDAIFVADGSLKGALPANAFDTQPYQIAKTMMAAGK
jgi:NitT/TauT family transport system substrate-binding protein